MTAPVDSRMVISRECAASCSTVGLKPFSFQSDNLRTNELLGILRQREKEKQLYQRGVRLSLEQSEVVENGSFFLNWQYALYRHPTKKAFIVIFFNPAAPKMCEENHCKQYSAKKLTVFQEGVKHSTKKWCVLELHKKERESVLRAMLEKSNEISLHMHTQGVRGIMKPLKILSEEPLRVLARADQQPLNVHELPYKYLKQIGQTLDQLNAAGFAYRNLNERSIVIEGEGENQRVLLTQLY